MRPVRILARLALVGLLVAVVGGVYFSLVPGGDAGPPHPYNQDRNAVWLEHRWLERPHSEQEMEQLFRFLDHHGMAYAFPHLIPFDANGKLPTHDREQMRRFLAMARQAAPRMKVLPWVGGLRVGVRRRRPGTINLRDLGQRQQIVAECRGLMDEGFDGVHLNIEPIASGDDDFLALLHALRTSVGSGILSLSAIRPAPMALSMAPNFFWSRGYYVRLASSADQVVVMAYDTAIPTSALYRRYLAYVARVVTRDLEASTRARVLVGVPTYDDHNLMHRRGVETAENALLGVVSGLRGVGGGGTFEGVALYAGWTTDATEWADYERVWRGHAGP